MLILFTLICFFVFLIVSIVFRSRRVNGVAFLHPYCETGGGGEAVLWHSIKSMLEEKDFPPIFVYTKSITTEKEAEIRKAISKRFDVDCSPKNVTFVHIYTRGLLEPKNYPRFTLLLQFIAGAVVGLECVFRLNPRVMVESTGIPLSIPVFKILGGARVLVYLHYPMITKSMIQLVNSRQSNYNNGEFIAKSAILSYLKYIYYNVFAILYGLCGKCVDVLLVNGSFTKSHISELWSCSLENCYPPVYLNTNDKNNAMAEQILVEKKTVNVVSLGQFRPEKNHKTQLQTVALLKEQTEIKVFLRMIGGVRNDEDKKLVEHLRNYAADLGLTEGHDFAFEHDATQERVKTVFAESMFAIHTMIDEHFGIAVVELLSAGLITIAHKSGGPLLDIIGDSDGNAGFLGLNADEFAEIISRTLRLSAEERNEIRDNAVQCAKRFDEQFFKEKWLSNMREILQ